MRKSMPHAPGGHKDNFASPSTQRAPRISLLTSTGRILKKFLDHLARRGRITCFDLRQHENKLYRTFCFIIAALRSG